MLVRVFSALIAAASVLLVMTVSSPLYAAEFTDLLDAADDLDDGDPETYNPWDFHIEPSFRFEHSSAEISREAPCVPTGHPTITPGSSDYNELADDNPRLEVNSERCDRPRIINNREMDFRQTRSIIDMTLRAGLYKDLELRFTIPYVIHSSRGLKYAAEATHAGPVNERNSSVDPSDDRIRRNAEDSFNGGGFASNLDQFQMYRFFELNDSYSTYDRSGLADPSLGIHWAPWSDYRDDTKATMLIGMDYTMPIARQELADNQAVGRGVHELKWKVAASKRFDWIEPYFGAEYMLPIARSGSLYGQVDSGADGRGAGQVLRHPPQQGLFTIGTEFIPYEDLALGARYAIDLRFQFGYTSEGRDYTPLFDHMTDPNNDCNERTIESVQPEFDDTGNLTNPGDVACAWVVQQPSNSTPATYDLGRAVDTNPTREFAFSDLASVDSYGSFGGQLGFYLQPREVFQFRGVVGLTHHQEHILTNARTGRSLEEGESVDMTDGLERNPAYNPAYDNSGDRFRVNRYNTWHFMMTTALQF